MAELTRERIEEYRSTGWLWPGYRDALCDMALRCERQEKTVAELVKALEFCFSTGHIVYSRRLKQNESWCDGVDQARAALAHAKEGKA